MAAGSPMPPPPGASSPGGPGGGPAPAGPGAGPGTGPAGGMPAFAIFAQITQLTQKMAAQFPMTSPMAEQIQNQVRMAVSKVAESQQPKPQQVPPI